MNTEILIPDDGEKQPSKRGGFRPIAEKWVKSCHHPDHEPPSMLCIPHGMEYVHICPACGQETIMRGSNITFSSV